MTPYRCSRIARLALKTGTPYHTTPRLYAERITQLAQDSCETPIPSGTVGLAAYYLQDVHFDAVRLGIQPMTHLEWPRSILKPEDYKHPLELWNFTVIYSGEYRSDLLRNADLSRCRPQPPGRGH